jgi:phenylpyruvate tautomerase
MPYFSIETNQTINQASNRDLMKKMSAFIAGLLGKPESYVMIAIKPETPLIFAGGDEPAAFVRLKSIGLPKARCPEFSEKICGVVELELKVPPNRVFIDFKDLERDMFGWDGKTF